MHEYIGKILEVLVPSTTFGDETADVLLAITDPDVKGDIEFLALATGRASLSGDILEIPAGVMPPEYILCLDKKYILNKSRIRKKISEVDITFIDKALRRIILKSVSNYYNAVHKNHQMREFVPGKSRINYAGRIYDEDEMEKLVDASLDFYLTADRYDSEFCNMLSAFLQSATVPDIHTLTVNSGSSANLIAISALTSAKLGDLALKDGDEVITVSAAFPTSVGPLIQNRLVPVFVDIELRNYNIDTHQIEKAISQKTKALMLAHSLGAPFDADKVLHIAERFKLWVIEDNCDALGAEYSLSREYSLIKGKRVSGKVKTGTMGHFGTSSFYPAHQITMGEGGAVYTTDSDLYKIALSFRDWGRDCWCKPGSDNTCGHRFEWHLGLLPQGYDHKYVYSHLGYNLKITDMQAAIGSAQMQKLSFFVSARRKNWMILRDGLNDLSNKLILPEAVPKSAPSWFGFALTVKEGAGFSRNDIVNYLESSGIQTRTLFAGNLIKHPCFDKMRNNGKGYRVVGELINTDRSMKDTFWIGVYPGLSKEMISYVIEKIKAFCSQKKFG
jgi:CDP-4-dehydro-6-deoxyglucose reductase, E1